jgi:hypothetical protein
MHLLTYTYAYTHTRVHIYKLKYILTCTHTHTHTHSMKEVDRKCLSLSPGMVLTLTVQFSLADAAERMCDDRILIAHGPGTSASVCERVREYICICMCV